MKLPNSERAAELLQTGLSIVKGRVGKTAISGVSVYSPTLVELTVLGIVDHSQAQVDGLRRWLGGSVEGRKVQLRPNEPGAIYTGEPVILEDGTEIAISTSSTFSSKLGISPLNLSLESAEPFIAWLKHVPESLPLFKVCMPLIEGSSPSVEAICRDSKTLADTQTFLGEARATTHNDLPWRSSYVLQLPDMPQPALFHLDTYLP